MIGRLIVVMACCGMATVFGVDNFNNRHTLNVVFKQVPIIVAEKLVIAEIADSPLLRSKGLMFRKRLPENHGMLFVFKKARPVSFWGKNTLIPLDVGFFDREKKLMLVKKIKPLSLRFVYCGKPTQYALEMRANWFRDFNLKAGVLLKFMRKDEV